MPLSTTIRNKLNGYQFGVHAYTPASTYYAFLHFCSQLAAGVSSGTNTISVDKPLSNGVQVTIDPDTASEETFTVTGISGSGPYTVTLSGNLAHNHLISAYVAFDPGPDGENINEPSSGYARVAFNNDGTTFPSASYSEATAVQITWADPSGTWGKVSHGGLMDHATLGTGHMVGYGAFAAGNRPVLDSSTPGPRLPAGNLIASMS